jgi:hypothetical protein
MEKSSEEPIAPQKVERVATDVAPTVATEETKPAVKTDEPKTDTQPKAETENATPPPQAQCKRMLKADVVALAQPIFLNRLGTVMPGGMVFALKRDTVANAGVMRLRSDKRPRPIVLRANVGDCIQKFRCTCRAWSGSQDHRTTARSWVETIQV